MPEGPSIVILKEEVSHFSGKKILAVGGNSKTDYHRMLGQKVLAFKSWGKHFLICFSDFTVKIHFLMFGSYRINEKKPQTERLHLKFRTGEINFYTCSVKILEGNADKLYDWETDVMNENWNPKKAREKLKEKPNLMVCDALLEQEIFSGVGNIIKNEVLYRIRVHPESLCGSLPSRRLSAMIKEARNYSFEFLDWKKKFELKKHWLAHTKKECLRCSLPIIKKYTGLKKRRSFFCTNCQDLYK